MENPLDPKYRNAEDDAPVVVGVYANSLQGSLARCVLEQAGIQCFLFDENMYNVEGLGGNLSANSNLFGGLSLVVAHDDAEAAKELLSQTGEGKGAPLR